MSTTDPGTVSGDRPVDPLRPVLRIAWGFVATVAGALLLFLAVSVFLPSTWNVSREAVLEAEAQELFPLISDLERWADWMFWPELGGLEIGSSTGVGASRAWDDPGLGDGVLTLTAVDAGSSVDYGVSIEGGAIQITGRLRLEAAEGGTRVSWTEGGDFGWNPFLRYMALGMPRMQGVEMEKSLTRLGALAAGGATGGTSPVRPGDPRDSTS